MKKLNANEMRNVEGGFGYRCYVCGKWFLTQAACGYHCLFNNHWRCGPA